MHVLACLVFVDDTAESVLCFMLAHVQVEIVMGLEEAFGITVEEESAQSITTVQEAADLIEKLVEKKDG